MAKFNLTVKYKKNRNTVISASELKNKYFFGIPVRSPDGSLMSDEDIEGYIDAAIRELQNELDIIIPLSVQEERSKFLMENYTEWSYIKTRYPVVCVNTVSGFIGTVRQINYPKDWLSTQKTNDGLYERRISIVPNRGSGGVIDHQAVFAGSYAQLGYYGNRYIPDYWSLMYLTGFDQIPADLEKLIAYKAAIPIYTTLGNLVLGAGIASQSLSIDGLSQNTSTTQSAENSAYSATIKDYQSQIKLMMPTVINRYKGITFGAV